MTDTAKQIEKLESLLPKLPQGKRNFADSLINGKYGYRNRPGRFSTKQENAVASLIDYAENPPVVKTEDLGDSFKGLIEIFEKASAHLKYPKISLAVDEDTPVVLSLLGPRSPNHGSVKVYNGVPYGGHDARWYGNVSPEGVWTQPRRSFEELKAVAELLEKMSRDPAGTAAEYGRLTGRCCFCNRKLEDERSTEVGYGPVCADHYGLPWG